MKTILMGIGLAVLMFWTASMLGIGQFQIFYGPEGKYKCEQVKP